MFVHQGSYKCNATNLCKGDPVMAVTPRHLLDIIQHFGRLYNEKRNGLEANQLHINVRLHKIAEAVVRDKEMQKDLAVKSAELATMNKEAEKQKQQNLEVSQLLGKQTTNFNR